MGEPNWANRTIFTGDNLDVMRGMNSESVDLIYLDPPFNSNRNYSAPVGSEAAGAAFKDAWTMDDVKAAEHGEVADRNPALYKVIDAAGAAHGKPMKAYLIMMGARLLEMQRILKPTGSIWLHCDDTAGAWLKARWTPFSGLGGFEMRLHGNDLVEKVMRKQGSRVMLITCFTMQPRSDTKFDSNAAFVPYDEFTCRKRP